MKVIIVEDEKPSAEHLANMLQRLDKSIEVVQYFDTVVAIVQAFQMGLEADLLFLDIHLADGNGFDIFSKVTIDIPIIFTTAYNNYAIQAFKQNSIDYLLKPIGINELRFALEKYKKQQNIIQNHLIERVTKAYQQMNKQYKTRFLVKMGQSIGIIQVNDIHHFETKDSISFLITTKGNRYAIDYTLDQLETILAPKDFFRINRKIIIHFQTIEKVNTYFNGRLTLLTPHLQGDERIVSRERVNDFKLWLAI